MRLTHALPIAMMLTACAAELSRHQITVSGEPITVMERAGGSWVAVPQRARVAYPATMIPLYIAAIEQASGCKVNRDAMAAETWTLEASVMC